MTRTHGVLVAVVCGVCLALALYGCDGGDGGDGGDDFTGDPAGFPDVRGAYSGTETWTRSGCTDPENNGTFTDSRTFTIFEQNGAEFHGSGDFDTVLDGRVTRDGDLRYTGIGGTGGIRFEITYRGALTGDTWTTEWSGQNTAGETCVLEDGQLTATRQ
jgi:hypothetical protein